MCLFHYSLYLFIFNDTQYNSNLILTATPLTTTLSSRKNPRKNFSVLFSLEKTAPVPDRSNSPSTVATPGRQILIRHDNLYNLYLHKEKLLEV